MLREFIRECLLIEAIGSSIKANGYEIQLYIPRTPIFDQKLKGSSNHASEGSKPSGAFWTSTLKAKDGKPTSQWHEWLDSNAGFDWINNQSWVYRVRPEAKILHIKTQQDSNRFFSQYGQKNKTRSPWSDPYEIDWDKVGEDWDALHYDNASDQFWDKWDVESTAWFNPKALKKEASVNVAPIRSQKENQPLSFFHTEEARPLEQRLFQRKYVPLLIQNLEEFIAETDNSKAKEILDYADTLEIWDWKKLNLGGKYDDKISQLEKAYYKETSKIESDIKEKMKKRAEEGGWEKPPSEDDEADEWP